MIRKFSRVEKIKGELNLAGDKSISHRALIFSAMADGTSKIINISNSEDVNSTISCLSKLGTNIDLTGKEIKIFGKGFKGFNEPDSFLDAGNSGTTTRLLAGILAAQNFPTTIVGDSSLSKRPMNRIIDPLTMMGAKIESSTGGKLPLKIYPVKDLRPIHYKLPIASAQVKSAVLLAGIHLDETTNVIETAETRNHTENILGLPISKKNGKTIISSNNQYYPQAMDYFVPADISSSAFFIVLTLILKNSELIIKNVLLNETRTGILTILEEMGADISYENVKYVTKEKMGDLVIRSSKLHNIHIPEELIPNIIDEIPILSVAGLFAEGEFKITGAEELRYKESDRISALCKNFKKLGLTIEEFKDGFSIGGNFINRYTQFESFGDHRIAMSFAILSILMKEGSEVNNFECTKISNPQFLDYIKLISK